MKKERVFWGLLFVLMGIFLIVGKLGYFQDINVLSLVLTVFLVVIIIKSVMSLTFPGILFPLAFICIIYDEQLGITNITPWTILLAALFGSIGLSMIFYKNTKWYKVKHKYKAYKDHKFEKIDIEDNGDIVFKTSFSSSIKYINTNNFERADLSCSFGGMKVYFDNAVMSGNSATVKIDASFSGIELFIPKSWKIENKMNVFLSGLDEKNKNNNITENTLILVGDINFSGIEIIYV